jgi:predicted enzyme related to lactoylglutathione lyase
VEAEQMHNRVIHFEIHAENTAKVAEFYRSVFGWEVRRWENPNVDYWIVMTAPDGSKEPGVDGGIVKRYGSVTKLKGADPMTAFVCTIQVANLDEYVKKIEKAGGRNVVPKMAIPGMAWLCYCIDIEGNRFGLFEADKNAK